MTPDRLEAIRAQHAAGFWDDAHGQRGELLAEVDRLRASERAILDAVGRLIQEAKHHHRGRGEPLEGPGGINPGLLAALRALEDATTPGGQ